MTDRKPQDYTDGEPDGSTDNTAAIQAAIDAWTPGDQVVLSGGTFRTTGVLSIAAEGLHLRGDAVVRAKSPFVGAVMVQIAADDVVVDVDGLEVDQAHQIVSGKSFRVQGCAGVQLLGLRSRNTQRSAIELGDQATDVLIAQIDHLGRSFGLFVADAEGVARITVRDSIFAHDGIGPGHADGVEINTPTFGSEDVSLEGVTVRGFYGLNVGTGIGFGFARVVRARTRLCRAIACENDGFHWENGSTDGLAFACDAIETGPVGTDTGSAGAGFVVYDSDRWHGEQCLSLRSQRVGISLIGNQGRRPTDARLRRCSVIDPARDGILLVGQESAALDRCYVRNPSLAQTGRWAGIHLTREGLALRQNRNCTGAGNLVEAPGSTPLGLIVVSAQGINCDIDGVASSGSDPAPGTADPRVAAYLARPSPKDEPDEEGLFFTDTSGWVD